MAFELINGAQFLHIPKTGGHWVEKVLRDNDLLARKRGHRHATYDQVVLNVAGGNSGAENMREALRLSQKRLCGLLGLSPSSQRAPERFRFCFVRHPLSWYESFWKFSVDHWPREPRVTYFPDTWQITAPLEPYQSGDFNEWMGMVADNVPGFVTYLYRCYAGPGITAIGRTENLRDDTRCILQMLGWNTEDLQLDQPPRNVSQTERQQQSIVWDPELRDHVQRLEFPALAAYGYLSDQEQVRYISKKPLPRHPALLS